MLEFELNTPIDISLCKFIHNRINPIVGIYKITSPIGKINIGQSTNIENRWANAYKNNKCKRQKKLYNSLKKYGVKNHTFEIIHLCKEEELNYWEDYYVKFYDTFNTPNGLNLREGGGNKGRPCDDSRKRMSNSQKLKFNFLSYIKCKKWIEQNELTKKIKTRKEWIILNKYLPEFIPKDPYGYYKRKGVWKSWNDFFNKKIFYSYKDAKKWVKENYIKKNQVDWFKDGHKLPLFIPKNPQAYYLRTNEWKGWNDFLGTNRNFLNYKEAKNWIKKNSSTRKIKTLGEWKKETKKLPKFIPKDPQGHYSKHGTWKGWGDFLNTGTIAPQNRIYYNYEETKKWVNKNTITKNIKTKNDWENIEISRLPYFIPKSPQNVFKNKGWKDWSSFLRKT